MTDAKTQTEMLCTIAGDPALFAENVNKLRLSDFPSLPVRLVFEVLRAHYAAYGDLPGVKAFPQEMLSALRGIAPDGKPTIETDVPQALNNAVAECMASVFTAIQHPSSSDTAYFKDKLKAYLSDVRLGAMPGSRMTSLEQIDEVARIKEGIDAITGGTREVKATSARKRVIRRKTEQTKRFGTGVWPIDIRTKMGMELGEVGCILAGSGVGKTNMMINFAANAALRGMHALFITLEVSEDIVLRRMHAMIGNFPMSLMDKPEEEWPKADLERYDFMLSDAFPNIGYVDVNYEYVDKKPTCSDIDREIGAWKDKMHKAGLSDDECPLVFVDYIRQIDPGSLSSKNDNTNTKLGEIMQQIKRMAMKHRCVIWTAQQVTRIANRKEHIRKDDIADSIAIVNHCDVILGFVPVGGVEQTAATTQETEDDTMENHSDKERLMNVDFVKLRNSGETGSFCTVFQGKSLRLWTSEQYCRVVDGMSSSMDFERFFTAMRPKEARK